jgi:dynactin 1
MSGFDPQRRRSIIGSSSRNASPNDISLELKVGGRVQVQGKVGTIRFVGTTSFQTGKWIGIELDDNQGKNSGVVQGKRYFDCKTNHGVFVRPSQVKRAIEEEEEEIESPALSPSISRNFTPTQSLTASRITSPSRISRLPATRKSISPAGLVTTSNKKIAESNLSASPTRKSKVAIPTRAGLTRPRSNTASQKDLKLQQLRQQQLKLQQLQQQQQEPEEEEEEEEEDQEELEDEEELERQLREEEELAQQYEAESNDTLSEQNVSTNSSTALPRQPPQPSYGSLATNLPVSKSDQMIPLKDYEELRLKLKILESKRQEDRERYREHEKVKEEAEQFLTLRNKLQDKIAELQKELRDTKRQLKDSTSEQEMYETKYNDVIESLEMMTLDKEVAEERSENLQQEVTVLKDKIEEISVDLDILKKEADIMHRVPDRDGEEKTPLEVIQLERHNERLKEALMRYSLHCLIFLFIMC